MNRPKRIRKGATVLIADDDPMFCVMLKQFFSLNGYTVVTVEDGDQAVQACVQYQPEIALLDGDMPEMDGFTACGLIRDMVCGEDMPIFIVTALEGEGAVACAVDVQASSYITKPINWADFHNKLSCVMEI
ncbi:MAG: response regulator [Mariprofundus sp.]|nr:response regulator [Mariprofundus sp.]